MTLKQISALHYILGRLEGLAEGLKDQNKTTYLLDTCEMLDELLREDKTEWATGNRAVTARNF